MSYRYMRLLVFFDLPMITAKERKNYTKFRKFLLTEGFIMMQESVYCKLALNGTVCNLMKEKVRKAAPKEGLIQMLSITEKQYTKMEIIAGTTQTKFLDTDQRLVVF